MKVKYFDLKNFSDKPSITCGWTFLHKDFNYLNSYQPFSLDASPIPQSGWFKPLECSPRRGGILA